MILASKGATMKWSLFDRVPEWIWMFLLSFGLMLFAICIFNASAPRINVSMAPKAKPAIYVTSRPEYLNIDGKTIYALEYTADGVSQFPVNFTSVKERAEFEGWLYQVGERAK